MRIYVVLVIDSDGHTCYVVLGGFLCFEPSLLPLMMGRITVKDPVALAAVRSRVLMNRRHRYLYLCQFPLPGDNLLDQPSLPSDHYLTVHL